jgi:hypothetical protein
MVTTVLEVVICSHDVLQNEATGCGDGLIRLHKKAVSHIQGSRISRYCMMSYLFTAYLTIVSVAQTICIASNFKIITNNDLGNTDGV